MKVSYDYEVTDELKINVQIDENSLQIDPSSLFKVAARLNKKRSFLFVSPVLGKHLPVNPSVALLIGRVLALKYNQQLTPYLTLIQRVIGDAHVQQEFSFRQSELPKITVDHPVTIIGFCETATALGQAFFESFSSTARYIHTTRENIPNKKIAIAFEEEHSHATAHRVYAEDKKFFSDTTEIILVDDEVTTGQTNLNSIRDIVQSFPHKKQFTIVSILDWRNQENQLNFRLLEDELNITIHEVSLLKGQVNVCYEPNQLITEQENMQQKNTKTHLYEKEGISKKFNVYKLEQGTDFVESKRNQVPYLQATGRFGLYSVAQEEEKIVDIATRLKQLRQGQEKCLVLGTGEFMYIPMKIASHMGKNVVYHTTTRSPILSLNERTYPIGQKITFESPEQSGVTNYLYGVSKERNYKDIFVIYERIINYFNLEQFNQWLSNLEESNLYYVDLISNRIYHSHKEGRNER